MSNAELLIGNQSFGGWTSVEVFRSMDALCGSFKFDAIEKFSGRQAAHDVPPGGRCRVKLDGVTVITGFVDDTDPEYDKDSHQVVIQGRDATGDLVDSSALHGGGSWTGASLMQIAQDLCGPFRIGVVSDVADVNRPYSWEQLQAGETVFEALSRLARIYAVVMVSDGRGNLVFTRAGSAGTHTSLEAGRNIEKANAHFSMRDRFSKYIVISQFAGAVILDPESAALTKGEATDPGVGRYRPLVILDPQGNGDQVYLQQRAIWEASHRAGKGRRATFTVGTWHDDNGQLFQINRMIPVKDAISGLNDNLIVCGTKFMLDEKGTRTELTVTRKSAYDAAPLSPMDKIGFDAFPTGGSLGGTL